MTQPRYTPLAQSLPSTVPFVGPETKERARGSQFAARLGANENIFGPSPKAVSAMQEVLGVSWMYGDPENYDLRQALATHNGFSAQNIVVGEGIDGLLGYLVRLLISPGDCVVTSLGAYPTFNYHVSGFGGVIHTVPYVDDHEDPASLFAKAAEVGAKIVYLANPDNPMGSCHRGADIVAAMDQLPEGCLLLLDEAYVECAPEGTAVQITCDDPRLIRMRTFSKAYGLAGLRVGYSLCSPLIADFINRVREPFNVNFTAQVAAIAALKDDDYLSESIKVNSDGYEQLVECFTSLHLNFIPSHANFIAVEFDDAMDIYNALLKEGVIVRPVEMSGYLRISIGTFEENAHLIAALNKILC